MNKTPLTVTIDKDVYLWYKMQDDLMPSHILNRALRVLMEQENKLPRDESLLIEEIEFRKNQIKNLRQELVELQLELSTVQSSRQKEHRERLERGKRMVDTIRAAGLNR